MPQKTLDARTIVNRLIALVPDSYIDPDPDAGIARLAGTVIGIVMLEPVLAAFHLFNGRKVAAAKDEAS